MKRRVTIAVGALVLIGLIGLGAVRLLPNHNNVAATVKPQPSTCVDTYRVLKLSPSQISAANAVCLTQTLQLTGELTGTVGQAYPIGVDDVGPTSMCSVPKRWDGFPQALLAITIASKAYRLRIAAPGRSEHQALSLTNLANVIELASIADPSNDWSRATGSLTLTADGTTGSIDASLSRDVAGARPVHVVGQWACNAPLAPQAVNASVPCASFYALNQLADADVARMKAGACHPENLTLGGDISGAVNAAVTDTTARAPFAGDAGDGYCEGAGTGYRATFKFSIGDESFLLDMAADRYPQVVPGQYPANPQLGSGGVSLWLGHADPTDQGRFLTDDHVFWLASGGSFTIATDMRSGTIDVTLNGAPNNAGSTVQITGSWRCAA